MYKGIVVTKRVHLNVRTMATEVCMYVCIYFVKKEHIEGHS